MMLYYFLLAHCLYLWYCNIFYLLPAYTYNTQLHSTGPLPIPIVLYYFLLPTAYPYGTLLFSTGPQPIPMVYYYHLLVHWPIPMVINCHLLAPCLSLWYSTTFYWHTAYTYSTLLPFIGPLTYPYGTHYNLLVPCLSLWYSTILYWLHAYPYGTTIFSRPTAFHYGTKLHSTGPLVHNYFYWSTALSLWYFTIIYWLPAFPFRTSTLLPSTDPLPIPVVHKYFYWSTALSLWYFTIIYWLPAFYYGTLPSSNGYLPIPRVL